MLLFLYCNWYLTLLVTEIGGLIMSLLSIITWRQQLCFILNWYWLLRPLARGSYTCLRRVTYHDFHARLHTGRETSGGESGRTGLMISITSKMCRSHHIVYGFIICCCIGPSHAILLPRVLPRVFHCCYWKQAGGWWYREDDNDCAILACTIIIIHRRSRLHPSRDVDCCMFQKIWLLVDHDMVLLLLIVALIRACVWVSIQHRLFRCGVAWCRLSMWLREFACAHHCTSVMSSLVHAFGMVPS